MKATRKAWIRGLIAVVGLVVALALPLSAARSVAASHLASTEDVSIIDFAFAPQVITIKEGDTISWQNNGSNTHTVTADDGTFDSGNLAPDGTFEQTFDQSGAFQYHCSIHSFMRGTIIVVKDFIYLPLAIA